MATLQGIKNNLKKVVNGLPGNKKADLYFEDRKRYIKLCMEGQQDKALKILQRNNQFYKDHSRGDPHAFHQAHHHFLSWSHDYTYYQAQRELIAYADREREMFRDGLEIMEFLESSLLQYKDYKHEGFLEHVLNIIGACKNRLNRDIKYYSEDLIPELERSITNNEYYKEHGYFKDVDPLGYKDLSWNEYAKHRSLVGTNKGPLKPIGTGQPG